jgi:hypothetical protein
MEAQWQGFRIVSNNISKTSQNIALTSLTTTFVSNDSAYGVEVKKKMIGDGVN